VFNDGAFEIFTEKGSKKQATLMMEHGQPLVFGENNDKGIKLDGFKPIVVDLNDASVNDLWIHDETDLVKATILSRFYDDPSVEGHFPRPFGVFYENKNKTPFDELFNDQIAHAQSKNPNPSLDSLIAGKETWMVS
jgi:2-oxoglutarate ferredoxin oxidoreductase subunit beta